MNNLIKIKQLPNIKSTDKTCVEPMVEFQH